MNEVELTRAKLKALEPYVPMLVRERVAHDPMLLTDPVIEHFPAAVLFADISGFTGLAEQLNQRGAVGAEQLKSVLDACFGELVDVVGAFAGDVIKFPGDGALVLWRVNPGGDLAQAVRLASKCALVILDRLDGRKVIEEIRLRLRVAIGAGSAYAACLGGAQGRWEMVVGGEAVAQIASAVQEAKPGEVVCSPQAWTHLEARTARSAGHGCRILREIEPSSPPPFHEPPRLEPEAAAALRQFIPRTIQTRIDAGQADWLAEFRSVTLVFINVRPPRDSSEGALEALQKVALAVQKAVYHFGGGVNEILEDDKGLTLVAAWGQSLSTHDDDDARACQAAMRVQQDLHQMKVESGIGIASGTAFVGTRGGPMRSEYAVIGDSVIVAARLMSAAPNTLLCDAVTRARARRHLVFESLPPVRLKGKADPVPVFRPLGPKQRMAPGRQPMFGRKQEQLQLSLRLDALAHQGEGGVVVISGDAGIGKSRMVADLLEQTHALAVRSVVGTGDDLQRSSPYYAWRGILDSLLRLERLDQEARRGRVLELIQSAPHREAAPLLNGVLAIDLPENETSSRLTAQARAERTREVLVQILSTALHDSRTLIVLEDAHWLDSASWALAEAIHQAIPRLLLVIVTRPLSTEQTPPEMRALAEDPKTVKMTFKTLEPGEALELLSYRLDADSLPESVAQLIQAKAEGHPLFLEQLAVTLRDKGVIRITDGECILAGDPSSLSSTRFPETIQAVIRGRIDSLTPEQQLTLKVASVLGPVSHVRELEQIHPIRSDAATLKKHLDVAVELDLLCPAEEMGSYRFKHAITREVAYGMLSFAQRQQLHRVVAEWLEGSRATKISEIYPLLAHHWTQANDTVKALDFLEKAGNAAIAAFANREAVNFFKRAIAIAESESNALSRGKIILRLSCWHRQIGEALWELGDLQESLSQTKKSLELLGRPIPESTSGKLRVMVAQTGVQAAHLILPNAFVERDPHRRACLAEAAEAASRLAWINTTGRDSLGLIAASLASVNWAQRAARQSVIPLAILGYSLGALKLKGRATKCFEMSRTNALALKQFHQLGLCVVMEAQALIGRGQLPRCAELLEETFKTVQSTGDREIQAVLANSLGIVAGHQGHFEEALKRALFYLDMTAKEASSFGKPFAYYQAAFALSMMSRASEASTSFDEYRRKAEEVADSGGQLAPLFFSALEAAVCLRMKEWKRAEEAADRASARPMSAALPPSWNPGFIFETYLGLWEHYSARHGGDVRRIAQSAHRIARSFRLWSWMYPVHQARYLHGQGQLFWLRGRRAKAMKAWQRGLELAEALGLTFDEGLCHYQIARRSPTDSLEGSQHAEKAREIFSRCKTPDYLDQVESLPGGLQGVVKQ